MIIFARLGIELVIMESNHSVIFLNSFRQLSIVELLYSDKMSDKTIYSFLEQIKAISKQLISLSIVVCDYLSNLNRFYRVIKELNQIGVSVSISLFNSKQYSDYYSIKIYANQIRLYVNEILNSSEDLSIWFSNFKTSTNNVVFLFEIQSQKEALYDFIDLLDTNPYVYNFSISHKVRYEQYWEIANYISDIKTDYSNSIIQEMTCAGVVYSNLQGICPARTSLLCVNPEGSIRFCFRDSQEHKLSIFEDSLNNLFSKITKCIPYCTIRKCSNDLFSRCMGGCPLMINGVMNKYCFYISNKGVL